MSNKTENEINALFEILKDLAREGIVCSELAIEDLHLLVEPTWVRWSMGDLSVGKLDRLLIMTAKVLF